MAQLDETLGQEHPPEPLAVDDGQARFAAGTDDRDALAQDQIVLPVGTGGHFNPVSGHRGAQRIGQTIIVARNIDGGGGGQLSEEPEKNQSQTRDDFT